MRMLYFVAAMAVSLPALAGPELEPACMIAANRLLDFILTDLPDNDAGRSVASTMEEDGRHAVVANIAGGFTDEQCAFLMVAPDSTVQALAKTITAD